MMDERSRAIVREAAAAAPPPVSRLRFEMARKKVLKADKAYKRAVRAVAEENARRRALGH